LLAFHVNGVALVCSPIEFEWPPLNHAFVAATMLAPLSFPFLVPRARTNLVSCLLTVTLLSWALVGLIVAAGAGLKAYLYFGSRDDPSVAVIAEAPAPSGRVRVYRVRVSTPGTDGVALRQEKVFFPGVLWGHTLKVVYNVQHAEIESRGPSEMRVYFSESKGSPIVEFEKFELKPWPFW
jgi:hypothetical protein